MKNLLVCAMSMMLFIAAGCNGSSTEPASTGWYAINTGLTNTNISSLVIDPANGQVLYAGTSGGIFKTTDGGSIWSPLNSELTATRIQSLAIDPTNSQVLYTSGYESGEAAPVFKSNNGGLSWNDISSGLTVSPFGNSVQSFVIDPTNSQVVYARTGLGLFMTTNGGVSWGVNTGLTPTVPTLVQFLAIDLKNSQTLYADAEIDTGIGKLFKTSDGGLTWNAIDTGMRGLISGGVGAFAVDPSDSQVLYLGKAVTFIAPSDVSSSNNVNVDFGVFKSVNGGESWSPVNSGLTDGYITSIIIDQRNSQIIYAGTGSGLVFKTADGGTNWIAVNVGLPSVAIRSLVIDPSNSRIIYAGTSAGVYKTTSGGE
jgi:photosystem II stability/assembly factor-like uncharacterized protein